MQRPLLLLTNDDGINAPGILALMDAVRPLGDVLVVAPDSARSAQSNALTVTIPLRARKLREEEGLTVFECNGTPTDCTKLGLMQLADRRPSLILSGINHGSNTSISVIYSGTMGAALEACVDDIPAMGISHFSYRPNADMTRAKHYASVFARQLLLHGLPRFTCLNVNIPDLPMEKGVKICRQAAGYWSEEFTKRQDTAGHNYYWLGGEFVNCEPDAQDTDVWAVRNGYVSVVPVQTDMTNYPFMQELQKWKMEE